jgi:rod shape-determining protein MreC
MVITSGLGGVFPEGLLIGNVSAVFVDKETKELKKILVKPAVNLDKLRNVFIIMNKKSEEK